MHHPCDPDGLADAIAELSAHLDAATHRFLTLIRQFDECGGWARQGALTCAHWLSWRVGLDRGAAREHVRVARALATLPLVDAALRQGQISYSKVRALTRVATPENEGALLDLARSSTAAQLERICRGYRNVLRDQTRERSDDECLRRWLQERETDSGLVRFIVQVTPEEAAVVRHALEHAMSRQWQAGRVSAEPPAASLRRVDALVAIAEDYLAAQPERQSGPPVAVVVHVDADTLTAPPDGDDGGTLADGTAVPHATVDRLACDAAVVEIVEDTRGHVLDVGRRRRTIPTAIRRALELRDHGCRFPGCTNRRVDGHHVVAWSQGGATALHNLLSLCRRHHTYVHELGFRVRADGAGGFCFFEPDGRTEVPAVAAPVEPDGDAIERMRRCHEAAGTIISPETNLPNWDGRSPDYGFIVHGLVMSEGSAGAS